jgi:hypothetical protein
VIGGENIVFVFVCCDNNYIDLSLVII